MPIRWLLFLCLLFMKVEPASNASTTVEPASNASTTVEPASNASTTVEPACNTPPTVDGKVKTGCNYTCNIVPEKRTDCHQNHPYCYASAGYYKPCHWICPPQPGSSEQQEKCNEGECKIFFHEQCWLTSTTSSTTTANWSLATSSQAPPNTTAPPTTTPRADPGSNSAQPPTKSAGVAFGWWALIVSVGVVILIGIIVAVCMFRRLRNCQGGRAVDFPFCQRCCDQETRDQGIEMEERVQHNPSPPGDSLSHPNGSAQSATNSATIQQDGSGQSLLPPGQSQ